MISSRYSFLLLFLFFLTSLYYVRYENPVKVEFSNSAQKFQPRSLGRLKDQYCSLSNLNEKVSLASRSEANDYQSGLMETMRNNENKLIPIVNSRDWFSYVGSFLPVSIGWIILFAFGLSGWTAYCFCSVFDKQCPPCQICKRDVEENPYNRVELYAPVIFTIFFGVCIIGIGSAGIYYTIEVDKSSNKVFCSIANLFDYTLYGTKYNETKEWLGIYHMDGEVTNIVNDLDQFSKNFTQQNFGDVTWLGIGGQNLLGSNENIYEKYSNSKLVTPSPSLTGTNFGPINSNSSVVGTINLFLMNTTLYFASILNDMYSASKIVRDNSQELMNTLNKSLLVITSVSNSISDVQNQVSVKLETPYKYIDPINVYMYIMWSFVILTSILAIFSIIAVSFFKLRRLRYFLHVAWFFYSFQMSIGFFLCVVMIPIAIFSIETCEIFSVSLKNETKYNDYSQLLPSEIAFRFKDCLFGQGEIMNQFGISESILKINEIGEPYYDLLNFNVSNLTKPTEKINEFITYVNQIRDGIISDSLSNENGDSNAENSLKNMNLWSDSTASGTFQLNCSATSDEWVFNITSCKASNTLLESNSATEFKGKSVCISFPVFDNDKASLRYDNLGCSGDVSNKIKNYFISLKKYDDSRRMLFDSLSYELNQLSKDLSTYTEKLLQFNQTMVNFGKKSESLIKRVSGVDEGFADSMNCKFMKEKWEEIYENMCIEFFVPSYYQIIFVMVTSLLLFFSSLLAYLGATRLAGRSDGRILIETWSPNSPNVKEIFN